MSDPTDKHQEDSKQPHSTGLWRKLALAVLILLAGGYALFRYSLSAKVDAALDRVRASGYPATLKELDDWYPQPSGENAAHIYRKAFNSYQYDKDLEDKLPLLSGEWLPTPTVKLSPSMRRNITDYLSLNADALRQLHQAAAINQCRYSVDLSQPVTRELEHLAELDHGSKLLGIEALSAADLGQTQDAWDSLAGMLQLADSVRDEPDMMSRLMQMRIHRRAGLTLEQLLARCALNDQQLQAISKRLNQTHSHKPLIRALAAARCRGNHLFEQGLEGNSTAVWRIWNGQRDRDWLVYMNVMENVISMVDKTPEKSIKIKAIVNQLPAGSAIRMTVTPPLLMTVNSHRRTVGYLRACTVGLAARRYQLARGRLPDDIETLVPKYLKRVPLDPIDQKPLRFKRIPRGAVAYSIGLDGVDNDGLEAKADGLRLTKGTDLTFTVYNR